MSQEHEESYEPTPAPRRPAPPYAAAAHDPRRRSPFLASLLSVGPGLGQVYCGYYQRGFAHALVVATIITLMAGDFVGPLLPLSGIFLGFFWIYNIIDAGRRAMLINEALDGRTNLELPDDFQPPGLRGSVAGGVAIAGLGVVLLFHTLLDYSLEWVEEWWPAALIAFGVYLVYKARQEQAKPEAGGEGEI